MASGLKVRLDDGSEVGPLELAMVRSWYEQGLINAESAVQRAGSKTWMKLSQAQDLRAWGNLAIPSKKAVRSRSQAAPAARGRQKSQSELAVAASPGLHAWAEHWGTSLGGLLLFAAALGIGYFHLRPQDAVPPLDRAPFWALALGLLAAGLALVPGWEMSRKLVRLVAIVAAVATFPLLGILFAQGVRGGAIYATLGVLAFFMAVFALLAEPAPHWARASLALLGVFGALYVTGRFGYSAETEAQKQVREAVTVERRFADPSLGLAFELPEGWHVLKKDAAVFPLPAEARVAFAHPRQQAFGYVETASSPAGVTTLDGWLDRVVAGLKRTHPGFAEKERTEVAVGRLTGRRASAAYGTPAAHRATVTVWRDGWIYYALVAASPEAAGAADLDTLTAGVSTTGTLAANVQAAVQKVTLEVPALTPEAAELLMAKSEAKVLEPDQAFRRSFDAVASALPTWKGGEAQEMARLIAACYQTLSGRDRARLAAYVDKVQKHQLTTPEEDREMGLLMKSAVLRLAPPKRARLQALYQKAVEAAVGAG